MKSRYLKPLTLLLLFGFICLACVAAQSEKAAKKQSDKDLFRLTGEVHTVRVEREFLVNKPGSGVAYGLMASFATLNRDGNCTELLVFNDKGELETKTQNEFDSSGNKIVEILYNGDNSIRAKFVRIYNDGVLNEVVMYNSDGTFNHSAKINHNDSVTGFGRVHDGLTSSFSHISRNKDGKPSEETFYTEDGKIVLRAVYTYNDNGETTENFDAKGVLISRYEDNFEKKNIRSSFVFDLKGNIIEKTISTYEHDSHGNWISETMSRWMGKNGDLSLVGKKVTKRTITFY